MSGHPPAVVLVGGDPVLGMNNIVSMKEAWTKASEAGIRFVEFALTNAKEVAKVMNAVDAEVSIGDWGEAHKVILLRGLVNVKGLKEALIRVASNVFPGNTLVVFDETGVIDDSWKPFFEVVEKNGFVAKVRPPFADIDKVPWGRRAGPKHVQTIIDALERRGKKISAKTVEEVFFERVPLDWTYIKFELEKLAELSKGEHITPEEVRTLTFPCGPGHAIYEYADAFNSGVVGRVLDKYDELIESGIDHEGIFSFTIKLLRWQMIAGHLLSYGSPLPQSLEAFGAHMTIEKSEAATAKLRATKPHLFKHGKDRDKALEKMQKEEGITPFMAKGVSKFVKDVLPRKVPIRSGALGTGPFVRELARRYVMMVNCIEVVRREGEDTARKTFRETMLKICWRD